MPWWGWMITGSVLFAAEMFGVSAQFYLVFLGAAALAVGLIGVLGLGLPDWAQWLVFAALAVAFLVVFRERIHRKFGSADGEVEMRLAPGGRIKVPAHLEPGASCRVDYRGSSWSARNIDSRALEAGVEAEIAHVEGLTLHLRHLTAP